MDIEEDGWDPNDLTPAQRAEFARGHFIGMLLGIASFIPGLLIGLYIFDFRTRDAMIVSGFLMFFGIYKFFTGLAGWQKWSKK